MFEWDSEKCKYPGLNEHKQICCSYLRSDLLFSYSCYSTVWFHWKSLALELWKMQLRSLSKKKTMSTLLKTKSWIQILKCYALDCRRRDQILCQSAFNQLHNFSVSFPWHSYGSGPLGRAMLAQLCKVNLCHRVLIFYTKLAQTFWSLQLVLLSHFSRVRLCATP